MTKKQNSVSKTKKNAEKSFEESLNRLEEIVNDMENTDPDLDKALQLFTEGVELVRFCSSKLSGAKKKIEILVNESGKMQKEKFTNNN